MGREVEAEEEEEGGLGRIVGNVLLYGVGVGETRATAGGATRSHLYPPAVQRPHIL